MEKDKREFGLLIETERKHGTIYITARLCARESGFDYPRGISNEPWDGKFTFDGLTLQGFISDYRHSDGKLHFIMQSASYLNVYSIEADRARKMARTLDKVTARIQADGASEPGELFLAMCRALKLSFTVGRSKRDSREFLWWDVPTGKRIFVNMIAEALDEANGKEAA